MLKKLTRSGFALKTVLASIALSIAGAAQAQVKVGDNVNTLTPSAVLEAESITQGFLPPRMLQVQMNAIVSPATGLIVYCLDCMPASPYFYNGTAWLSFVNGNPTAAAYAANSLSCTGTLAGTYTQGIALTSGNTKTITITVNAAGGYSAATSVVNGVSFAGNGAFATTGANKTVTLTGTGTPTAAGTFAYTASLGGQTCTFNVTYSSASTAAVFSCVSPTVTQSPAGALVNGTAYTGTYTLPYTGGNGAAYGSAAQTVSGLTLTRTAGTYAAGGGNVVYNLTGTYTGNTGAASFSIAECGTFSFPAGQVSTVTGNGNYGYQDGPVATAEFNTPQGIAIDAAGNIYVGDMANNNIRKITPSGTVSTFAGSINNPNGTGAAYVNATGSAARFDKPTGLAIDASGNIYVADKNNNSIRKITPAGAVTTLAGSTTGASGNTNATGTSALFSGPTGVAVDASGNVYVADAGNHRIRRIDGTTLAVTTLAGSLTGFQRCYRNHSSVFHTYRCGFKRIRYLVCSRQKQ